MKKILLVCLVIGVFWISRQPALAIDCEGSLPGNETDLQQYIDSCKSKIDQLVSQAGTLKAAIQLLNSKINLTTAQIKSTAVQIVQLEKDIQTLSGVIVDLNSTLDDLSKIYVSRLRQSYKDRTTNPLVMFFASESFTTFQNKLKYLTIASKRDQIILHELESTRVDLDSQKTAKETKQEEIEALKKKLESQKLTLDKQNIEKKNLLTDTQNSEKKYQQLLSDAQRQLAAFRRFVTSQGGASILTGQTHCDSWGCYYNQRDSEWGNQLIGLSSDSLMKDVGCLITSMAMIISHSGKTLTPGQIAASSEPFFNNTAYMQQGSWTVNGVTTTRTRLGSSTAQIDSELAAGRPVVVGIYNGPDHFLVIKEKKDGQYIMNDPFIENGHDMKFTDKYPLSVITVVDRVSVQ
jgi:peptidoglycan hydrolase CwlO-like protein